MAKCPACRSTRIYRGYRPAPLLLRLFFIHDFLCENCNLQFRRFSLTPPRSRRRRSKKNTSHSHQSSHSTEGASSVTVPESRPTPQPLNTPVLAQAQSATGSGLGQAVPSKPMTSQKEPPSPPTPIPEQWPTPAQALEEYESRRHSHRSHQVCPHCGAADTERRRRKLWEKAIFAFTNIRAYQCRICGADFYARRKKKT